MRVRGGGVCVSWWRLAVWNGIAVGGMGCGMRGGPAWSQAGELRYSVFVVELGGWPGGWRLVVGLERALRRLCTGQGVAVMASGRLLAAAFCDLNTKRLQ